MESTAHLQTEVLKHINNPHAIVMNTSDYQKYQKTTAIGNIRIGELKNGKVSAFVEVAQNAHYQGNDYAKVLRQQREAFAKSINSFKNTMDVFFTEMFNFSDDTNRILRNRGHQVSLENVDRYLLGVNSRRTNNEWGSETRKDMVGTKVVVLKHVNVAANYLSDPNVINLINMDAFAKERGEFCNRLHKLFNDNVMGATCYAKLKDAVSKIRGFEHEFAQAPIVQQESKNLSPTDTLSIDQKASDLLCGLTVVQNSAGQLSLATYDKVGNTYNKYHIGAPSTAQKGIMELAGNLTMRREGLKPIATYTLGQDKEKDAAFLYRLEESQNNVKKAISEVAKDSNGEITITPSFTEKVGNTLMSLYRQKLAHNNEQNNTFKLKLEPQTQGLSR